MHIMGFFKYSVSTIRIFKVTLFTCFFFFVCCLLLKRLIPENNIIATIEFIATHDDKIQIFYFTDSILKPREKNSYTFQIKGSNEVQKIRFKLPTKIIERFRIDLGNNRDQKEITLNHIEIHGISGSWIIEKTDIEGIFKPNKFIIDQTEGTYKLSKVGAYYDPYLLSVDISNKYASLLVTNNSGIAITILVSVILSCIVFFGFRKINDIEVKEQKWVRISFVAAFVVILIFNFFQLEKCIKLNSSLSGYGERLIYKDSKHYYDIGKSFSQRNYSMDYVDDYKAHRQPLYPLLLSLTFNSNSDNPISQNKVNVILYLIICVLVYVVFLKVFKLHIVAFISGLFVITNSYLLHNVSSFLLTEPLYILLTIPTFYYVFKLFETNKSGFVFAGVIFSSLAYLTRTNGLFLIASILLFLFVNDLQIKSKKLIGYEKIKT